MHNSKFIKLLLSGSCLFMLACVSLSQVPSLKSSQSKNNYGNSNIKESTFFYPLEKDGSDSLGKGQKFKLNNISFDKKALFSDGTYDAQSSDADYNAILQIPSMNYKKFSISLFFFPVRWGKEPIIAFGQGYRWFIVDREWSSLKLTFNNHEYVTEEMSVLKVLTNQWNSLIISWDLEAKTIFISLNNSEPQTILFPKKFKLDVFDVKGKINNEDKNFLFTDYSIGSTFKGYIRNLRFYDRPISKKEIIRLNKHLQEEITSLPASDSLILTPPRNKSGYFLGNISDFRQTWFSKHLQAMKEPMLNKADSNTTEQYRFLWLRTFHNPIAIRITKGDKIELRAIALNGKGGYEPGEIKYDKTIEISNQDWKKLIELIDKSIFWQMPSEDHFGGFDGSEWILEGYRNDQYYVVCRWSPQSQTKVRGLTNYCKVCLYLLKLSNMAVNEKDFY